VFARFEFGDVQRLLQLGEDGWLVVAVLLEFLLGFLFDFFLLCWIFEELFYFFDFGVIFWFLFDFCDIKLTNTCI
jgi:hypothetical protein